MVRAVWFALHKIMYILFLQESLIYFSIILVIILFIITNTQQQIFKAGFKNDDFIKLNITLHNALNKSHSYH